MARNTFIAIAQSRLDDARRQLRGAVVDFRIPDEKILELRANARHAFEELAELDRKARKKGLFGFLGF